VALGAVRVVADADPRVRQVLARARWATAGGSRWRARQAARLEAAGWTVTALPLHRGWYGFVVRGSEGGVRLVALPPAFPVEPPRLLRRTPDGWTGAMVWPREKRWGAYDLPAVLAESEDAA
jgi:hypothetical protein